MSLNKILITTTIVLVIAINGCQNNQSKTVNQSSKPINVIFMIGDGMGLTQVSTSFYFKESKSNFERFKSIGLCKTSSTSHKITDSAAGATAFATGEKTYKRAIGVSKDSLALPTILEQLEERGYNSGLISLTSITHATPASFYAHVTDRDMHEEIATSLPGSGVDFFAGGGLKYFNNRNDQKDLYLELQNNGYTMDTLNLSPQHDPEKKYGYFFAEDNLPNKTEGRGTFLQDATHLAIEYFSAADEPFFLMIEGSYIDWAGHDNNADMMVQEVLDFDETIGIAMDYVDQHENTILIVTADHETGGTALGKYYKTDPENGKKIEVPDSVAIYFVTDQHTTTAVPVFAYGQGEEYFSGIYENNEIYHKLKRLLKF